MFIFFVIKMQQIINVYILSFQGAVKRTELVRLKLRINIKYQFNDFWSMIYLSVRK